MTRSRPVRRRVLALVLAVLVTLGAGHDATAAELRIADYQRFCFRPTSADLSETISFILRLQPEEDVGAVTDGQDYRIVRERQPRELAVSIRVKYERVGTVSVGPFTLRVNGAELRTPGYKVVVLPPLAENSGLTVVAVTDPNGTGVVMVDIEDRRQPPARSEEDNVELDKHKLPAGIHTLQNVTMNGEIASSQCLIRNANSQEFVLGPEHFKNLPKGYSLPRIVVPPNSQATWEDER